jgi:hypothetical protein
MRYVIMLTLLATEHYLNITGYARLLFFCKYKVCQAECIIANWLYNPQIGKTNFN